MHYADKTGVLQDIFGTSQIHVGTGQIRVGQKSYPIVDDVIILVEPQKYTPYLKSKLARQNSTEASESSHFARDIQFTFGEEWKTFNKILPEHQKEFDQYFDVVDLSQLKGKRVCDLGCGNGRWSYFLTDVAKEIILVDFSDAIFVARRNLSHAGNTLFFMGDLRELPFRNDFADFLYCIGVLHHLPTPCLEEARSLATYAPEILVFLYYSLDNRPFYFRIILRAVTAVRTILCRIRNEKFRRLVSSLGTYGIYFPLVGVGSLLQPLGLSRFVPLYEAYHGKGAERIRQDVYDRFFTRIEQRVSRKEISDLKTTFRDVQISDHLPYWHFRCKR